MRRRESLQYATDRCRPPLRPYSSGRSGPRADPVRLRTATCNLYHDECTYSNDVDGRKPPARTYVAALEQRIKVLEQMLNQPDMDEGLDDGEDDAAAGLDRLKLDEETCEFLQCALLCRDVEPLP